LLEIETINANKVINDKSLSDIFNKVINFRYKAENKKGIKSSVSSAIDEINENITKKVEESHTSSINKL